MAKRNGRDAAVGKDARVPKTIAAVDILRSAVSELRRAERQIWALARMNEALADGTHAHITGAIARIERRDHYEPLEENRSFLPPD